MTAYLAAASLVWGFADASMDQPLDLEAFDAPPAGGRVWRVAHLSDIHIVGERYGFRIESGRAGHAERAAEAGHGAAGGRARGPAARPCADHRRHDRRGTIVQLGKFFDIVARHPGLAARTFVLPGNHDVNVVDRSNPARLDLPFSPAKTLRKMRALSAIAAFGADRLLVMSDGAAEPGPTLAAALAPGASGDRDIRRPKRAQAVEPSRAPLGRTVPARSTAGRRQRAWRHPSQFERRYEFLVHQCAGNDTGRPGPPLTAALDHYPKARSIVALHHHLIEYPMPVAAFSERIGTALINGSWFERVLKPYAPGQIVVMHGHRHVDWIGACGELRIVSAPSPVMAPDSEPTHFHIHALGLGPDGRLVLAAPGADRPRPGRGERRGLRRDMTLA